MVEVDAPPGAAVGDVLDAVAVHLGRQRNEGTVQARDRDTGAWLDRRAPLAASPLVSGSSLALEARAGDAPPASGEPTRWQVVGLHQVDGGLGFNRPPRRSTAAVAFERRLDPPPSRPRPRRLPLGAIVVPLVVGVGGTLVFAIGGSAGAWRFLLFALLSPLMLLWNHFEERHAGGKHFAEDRQRFVQEVEAAGRELAQARQTEITDRRRGAPSVSEVLGRASGYAPSLWERRLDDPDALRVRVGTSYQQPRSRVTIDAGGEPELRAWAEQMLAADAPLALPATVHLSGVTGLCGDSDGVERLARSLVVQVAGLHAPSEVALAVVMADTTSWDWVVWLPHLRALGGEGLLGRGAGAEGVVDRLLSMIGAREDASRPGSPPVPAVLVVVEERTPIDRRRVGDVLRRGPAVGVYVVWLGSDRRALPVECTSVVEVGGSSADIDELRSGGHVGQVQVEHLDERDADAFARALAPLVEVGTSTAASIPSFVSLTELEGIVRLDAEAIEARWNAAGPGLVVALGRTAQGTLTVDLDAVPHILVAGMTGSGKSELLVTLVSSLAVRYSPSRVTFLLVDYKGGAAFDSVDALPHILGVVTDLDPHLTQRALVSLDAELARRERILAEHGARSLAELQARRPEVAPPSLVLVIDEFKKLADELRTFLDGVIDVAVRGRSLGVHLVLATQSPRGVVTDAIRANIPLRIALRVADAGESQDVLASPVAATVPLGRPGRGYARLGSEAPLEVQFASTSGGPDGVVVRDIDGTRSPRREPTSSADLVEAISMAGARAAIARPASPWLPPLPDVVDLASIAPIGRDGVTAVGIVDEPRRQRQRPFEVDLAADGGLLVLGTGRSGKSTFVRTLVCALAGTASPEELHLYAIDVGSRSLDSLGSLPHVAAVVPGEDQRRVSRVLRSVAGIVSFRQAELTRSGATSLAEYRSRVQRVVPRVLLVLDGYAGFATAFERVDGGRFVDLVARLATQGPAVGVNVVITADRRGAVPGALAAAVPRRIVLRLAELDEYGLLGVDRSSVQGARLPPGRGFVDGLEVQIATVGGTADEVEESAAVRATGARMAARWPELRAPQLRDLGDRIGRGELPPPPAPLTVMIGLADDDLAPVSVDLTEGHLLVTGPPRSGRSTALVTIAMGLGAGENGTDVRVFAPRRSPVGDGSLGDTARGDACDGAAAALAAEVADRPDDGSAAPLIVLIDDADELRDRPAERDLEVVARLGRDRNVHVIAASETRAAHHAFGGVITELKRGRRGLLLAPEIEVDGDLMAARLPREGDRRFPPGRGYLVDAGAATLVQVTV